MAKDPFILLIGTFRHVKRRHELRGIPLGAGTRNLQLRHVVCLGKFGEAVEAVCCTNKIKKPWLIVLPNKKTVECHILDCFSVCKSAISASRRRKLNSKEETLKSIREKYFSYADKIFNENYAFSTAAYSLEDNPKKGITNNSTLNRMALHSKLTAKSENRLKVVKVPKIVLELLELCKSVEGSENFTNLKEMCKFIDIPLGEFLNNLTLGNSCETSANPLCLPTSLNNNKVTSSICSYGTTVKSSLAPGGSDYSEITCNSDWKDDSYELMGLEPFMDLDYSNSTEFLITRDNNIGKSITIKDLIKTKVYSRSTFPTLLMQSSGQPIKEYKSINNSNATNSCCCKCFQNRLFSPGIQDEKMKKFLLTMLTFPKVCEQPIRLTKKQKLGDLKKADSQGIIPKCRALKAVEHYVSVLNENYLKANSDYKRAAWDYETNITTYTRQKAMEAGLLLSQFQRDLNKKLSTLQNVSISDPTLLRQIKLLYISGMNSPSDLQWNEFEQVLYAMRSIYVSASVNKWNEANTNLTLFPVIADVMATSKNADELRYYWSEWRKATGKRIRPLFDQYVTLMTDTAKKNGAEPF